MFFDRNFGLLATLSDAICCQEQNRHRWEQIKSAKTLCFPARPGSFAACPSKWEARNTYIFNILYMKTTLKLIINIFRQYLGYYTCLLKPSAGLPSLPQSQETIHLKRKRLNHQNPTQNNTIFFPSALFTFMTSLRENPNFMTEPFYCMETNDMPNKVF
jgi:hypothetical protein